MYISCIRCSTCVPHTCDSGPSARLGPAVRMRAPTRRRNNCRGDGSVD